jgi:hypothetical protein
MILLPPITREEDLLPAIDLLFRGEALVVAASFRRPQHLSSEIVWSDETRTAAGKNKLRCVRRKSESELTSSASSQPSYAQASSQPSYAQASSCCG